MTTDSTAKKKTGAPQSSTGQPAITRVMEPVAPGHFAVATVGGMRDDVKLYLHRLPNGDPGLPDETSAGPKRRGTLLKIVQRKEECLTIDVPKGPHGVFALSLGAPFDPAQCTIVNRPRLDWAYPSAATVGESFRLIGRNLVGIQHYVTTDPTDPVSYGGMRKGKTRVVARRQGGRRFIEIPVDASSTYEARLQIPRGLKPGPYEFFAHNGRGGALGWSLPLQIDVQRADRWPNKVFRIDAYLAGSGEPVSTDDAIVHALADIEANGGGVLQFGANVYHIGRTIVLPRRTVLRGEGRERTLLQLPVANGPVGPWVAITGDGDFVVEDVRIFSLYAPMLIAAPRFEPQDWDDAFSIKFDFVPGRRARNVTVRRCHLHMRINAHEDRRVDIDKGQYKMRTEAYMLSQGQGTGGYTAITLRGDDLNVEQNTIFGGGSCVMMLGCTSARVADNRIEIGPAGHGIYAMGHLDWPEGPKTVNGGAPITGNYCKHILLEDNHVSGYSQTARDGVYLMYGVEKAHVARNRITDIESTFDAEGLGLHLWSGRWTGAGLEMVTPTRGRIIDPDEQVKYECLDDAQIEIVEGPGMGQLRRILQREDDYVEIDRPWDYTPRKQSQVVFTAPPLFDKINIVDNTIHNTGANLIMWGCSTDCVVDGNRLADGPHLGVWSVRVQGDQKVWGGAAFVSVINNVNTMGWIAPRDEDLAGILRSTGGGMIGNPCCAFGDSEKMGYDFLGLIIRNNAAVNNSGIFFRRTWPMYQSEEPWVLNDYGVVIEANCCRDSRVGVVIERGAAAVQRRNRFRNVKHRVVWAEPVVK